MSISLILTANANPVTVSGGWGGSLTHGDPFTITGSGFGTKSVAAPLLWDTCTGTLSSNYAAGASVPNAAAAEYNLQYRDVGYRGVAAPHARCSRYMAGSHPGTSPYNGQNVMFNKPMGAIANGDVHYIRGYYRLDPAWVFSSDNNHKHFNVNFNGNGPYEDTYIYVDYNQAAFTSATGLITNKVSPYEPYHPITVPDANGEDNWWGQSTRATERWVLHEFEIRYSDGTAGYLKMWADGALIINYYGRTRFSSSNTATLALGGYTGVAGASYAENFRYFADIYADTTAARLVLTNSASAPPDATSGTASATATIIEPQVVTAWSDGSITATCNRGALSAGTAYAWVRTSAGAWVSAGSVTLG